MADALKVEAGNQLLTVMTAEEIADMQAAGDYTMEKKRK